MGAKSSSHSSYDSGDYSSSVESSYSSSGCCNPASVTVKAQSGGGALHEWLLVRQADCSYTGGGTEATLVYDEGAGKWLANVSTSDGSISGEHVDDECSPLQTYYTFTGQSGDYYIFIWVE